MLFLIPLLRGKIRLFTFWEATTHINVVLICSTQISVRHWLTTSTNAHGTLGENITHLQKRGDKEIGIIEHIKCLLEL